MFSRLHFSSLSRRLQKEQGILQERVSVLELKCSELQISNRDMAESLEREKSSARSAEATRQQQRFAEEKERLTLEATAKEAQTLLEESRKKANDLIADNEKLQQELAVAAISPPPPSPPKGIVEDPDVVVALRAKITGLQNEKEELIRKCDTIEERYKNGDLVCSTFPNLRTVID